MSMEGLQAFIFKCLSTQSKNHNRRIDRCISGILNQFNKKAEEDFLSDLIDRAETNGQEDVRRYRLLLNAPFTKPTWTLLQKQNKQIQKNTGKIYTQAGMINPLKS
ncbi:MAG: hypothetical protein KAI44_00020 [Methylococcales bacterium]|nr:hypothetical protein [Methylococcales bacterium]